MVYDNGDVALAMMWPLIRALQASGALTAEGTEQMRIDLKIAAADQTENGELQTALIQAARAL